MIHHNIDCIGTMVIQRLTTVQRTEFPYTDISNPTIGRIVFDTDLEVVYIGDGSNWILIGTGGGGGGAEMKVEEFVTGAPSGNYTGGTTVFEFSVFTYLPTNTEILVFSNNLLMKLGTDYTETAGD